MRVDTQRDRRVPMPELLTHVGDRRAGLQEQRRVRVPQIVNADLTPIGLRQ